MFSQLGLKTVLILIVVALAACSNGIDNVAGYELSDLNSSLLNQFTADEVLEIQKGTYTYEDIRAHGFDKFTLDTVVVGSKPSQVSLQPSVALRCHKGEMDLVKAAQACNLNTQMIMTILDQKGETVAANFGALNTVTYDQMLAQMKLGTQNLTAYGDQVEVFLCLDSNQNGKCTDEKVFDLNIETAQLKNDVAAGSVQIQADPVCLRYSKGVLLYHSLVKIFGDRVSHLSQTGATSAKVKGILNNVAAEASVNIKADGEASVLIPVPMVEFSGNACVVAKRTDGCFAKGTKIQMSDDTDRAIESLIPGEWVKLASGQKSKIEKVVVGPEAKPMVIVTTSSKNKVEMTSLHPVETSNGLKTAEQLSTSDQLRLKDGSWVSIQKIERKKTKHDVYNIELKGSDIQSHLIISNGIVTGDLYLQKKLQETSKVPSFLSAL